MKLNKDFLKKNSEYFLLGLIILLAFLLRVLNLDHLPVFADEAIYVRWAQIIKNEPTLRFIPLSDGKQPLFMWVVWPVLTFFQNPLIAGRIISVFSGIITLVGIYFASYLLFKSKKSALLASLIYGTSPFAVFFDRMALVDSMFTAFTIWTFILFYKAMIDKRLDYAMLSGFALGGGALTKSPALFIGLLLPTVFLLIPRFKKQDFFIYFSFLLVTWGIAFGMYNVLRLGPNFHLLSTRTSDYVYPLSHLLDSPFNPLIPHFFGVLNYFLIWGPAVLFALLVIGKLLVIKEKFKELLVVGLWAIVPILIVSEFSKTMTARYVLYSFPFLAIISGLSLYNIKNHVLKKLSIILITVFVFHSLFINYKFITNIEAAPIPSGERSGYLEEWTSGVGLAEVADYIATVHSQNPDKKIVVGAEGYFGTPLSALEFYLNDLPEITVIGIGVNLTKIPEPLIASKEAGNITYLVINTSRLNFVPEVEEAQLLFEYPKPTSDKGVSESLLLYQIN